MPNSVTPRGRPHARAYNLAYIHKAWKKRLLPPEAELAGKSVLDVGCWAGGWAKVAMEKGAGRVMGVDVCRSPELIKDVEFRQLDFMSEAANQLPQFDYVFLFGVLYHTYNPMGMLMQARRFAKEQVFVETAYAAGRRGCVLEVFNDHTNWFKPSTEALLWMMRKAGLAPINSAPLAEGRIAVSGRVVEPEETLPRGRTWMTK